MPIGPKGPWGPRYQLSGADLLDSRDLALRTGADRGGAGLLAGLRGAGMGYGWRFLVAVGVVVMLGGVYWAYNLH